jgi:hypothetical protein
MAALPHAELVTFPGAGHTLPSPTRTPSPNTSGREGRAITAGTEAVRACGPS